MACIKVRYPGGELVLWPEGAVRPSVRGEVVEGVDWSCDYQTNDKLERAAQEAGLKVGDLIQTIISYLPQSVRPEHCSSCEEAKIALNEIDKVGFWATIKKVKKIKGF